MQIQITVPDQLIELAAKAGLDTEDYVQRLLGKIAASYPAGEAAQARLREDLLADWNDYQQTGLHLNDDEVDTWLERLALDPSPELPALHK